MGIEYKVVCEPKAIFSFDEFLRRSEFFDRFDEQRGLYHLRVPGQRKRDVPPLGWVALEPDGLYFCDNLTAKAFAAQFLRLMIDHALSHSQTITIHEP